MKMKNILLVIGLFLSLILAGCSSAGGPGPRIWIDSPLDGSILTLDSVIVRSHSSSLIGTESAALYVNNVQTRLDNIADSTSPLVEISQVWLPDEPGVYTIYVTAADVEGNLGQSNSIHVEIRESGNEILPDITTPMPEPIVPFTPTDTATPTATFTPTNTATPTATFTPTPSLEADIQYWAEPDRVVAGKCSTIYWKVENVKSVEFGGFQQEFEGSYDDCICVTSTYPMSITYLNNTTEKFYLTIQVDGSCVPPTAVPQPPKKPNNLTVATNICSSSDYAVLLSWNDNADNETGYRVFRDGVLIVTLGAGTTQYTDHPPYSGPHNYYIEAFNNAGSSQTNTKQDQGCVY